MLHKYTCTYREIAKHFPELKDKLSSSAYKKRLLLETARKGEPKPDHKTKMGMCLNNYTKKTSKTYDPSFAEEIKKIRPDWFVSSSRQKKNLLLAMQGPKPKYTDPLGLALDSYTRKKSDSYDPIFHKQIKKLHPDWFVPSFLKNKRCLLDMAKKKKPKPARGSELYAALWRYTCKTSKTYDSIFADKIKKIAPQWFKRCFTN